MPEADAGGDGGTGESASHGDLPEGVEFSLPVSCISLVICA